MSDKPSDHLVKIGISLSKASSQFHEGDEVETICDLMESYNSDKVVCPKGTKLVVTGPSKNFLFPISVAKPDDLHWRIAVRPWEIQKVHQA